MKNLEDFANEICKLDGIKIISASDKEKEKEKEETLEKSLEISSNINGETAESNKKTSEK